MVFRSQNLKIEVNSVIEETKEKFQNENTEFRNMIQEREARYVVYSKKSFENSFKYSLEKL